MAEPPQASSANGTADDAPAQTTNGAAPESARRFTGDTLMLKGARQHNLKNVDLTLPKKKLVVVTGPSGSGKSSLVFDTIYAEGQRRYVESLSAYARQFLERMDKPDVDLITGLAPAIAIEQQSGSKNPRSTVATQTEVYDHLRLLFARIGTTISPKSGQPVTKDSPRSVAETLQRELPERTRFYLCFPFPQPKGVKKEDELTSLLAQGFYRILALPTDNQAEKGRQPKLIDLNQTPPKDVYPAAERLLVLVDRLATKPEDEETTSRIADSAEMAFREGEGHLVVVTAPKEDDFQQLDFSAHFERDGMVFDEPTAQLFSFNSPIGACPTCQGFGRVPGVDEDLVIPNPNLSIRQDTIAPFRGDKWSRHKRELIRLSAKHGIDLDTPYTLLPQEHKDLIWEGEGDYIGIRGFFDFLGRKSYKMHYRIFAARFRGYTRCSDCDGYRLRNQALCVKLRGPSLGAQNGEHDTTWMHIGEICELTTEDAQTFMESLVLTAHDEKVAGRILEEIRKRLRYLNEVGLDYLTLDRLAQTLSGGETQRINLATSLGSSLVGSLYVLDEPTIGLHPRDNDRLITILEGLRDLGNTVLVVEHDQQMMERADQIVDIGPGSGSLGGEVVFQGTYEEVVEDESSLTGAYLSGRKAITVPDKRRPVDPERVLELTNARANNLKRLDVRFPLDTITVVTGVSGSGKSTLVHRTLFTALTRLKGGGTDGAPGKHDALRGAQLIDAVEMVDQSPIGRTPRSNPVTYIKAFDGIRALLADTHQAQIRGYAPGTFSFNVPGGRCEVCQGEGVVQVEMQFLADLYLECEACRGKRYKQDVLEIRWRGKNIAEILDMTVDEAADFFEGEARVTNKLEVLQDVGLGYLTLGQPSNTLSGGEAQRVKLASHLAKTHSGHTLYLFDEPTTGLHFDDIRTLLDAFNALVEAGNSVILIEHNLDVIKAADWVIDLGPEGGRRGGFIVTEGTPEAIAQHETSHTGRFLREVLG